MHTMCTGEQFLGNPAPFFGRGEGQADFLRDWSFQRRISLGGASTRLPEQNSWRLTAHFLT